MSFRKKSKGPRNDKRKGVAREIYNVPDVIDIANIKSEYEKFSAKLDDSGKPKPLTEAHLKNIIISAVRQKWMHCDVKLAFIYSKLEPDYDLNTRRLFKIQCNICKEWFTRDCVDVDHIIGHHQFVDIAHALEWANSILHVSMLGDLQILCKDVCHPIKTLSESHDISFEEAKILQHVIKWENQKDIDHKRFLIDLNFSVSDVTNKEKRRNLYLKYLFEQSKK